MTAFQQPARAILGESRRHGCAGLGKDQPFQYGWRARSRISGKQLRAGLLSSVNPKDPWRADSGYNRA
jgi:hypothetical protein